jgi:hypothetical protein
VTFISAIEVVAGSDSALKVPLVVVRAIAYTSAALLFSQIFSFLRVPQRIVRIAALTFWVAIIGTFFIQASYEAGRSWSDIFDPAVLSDALVSPLGIALAVQGACALALMMIIKRLLQNQNRTSAVQMFLVLVCLVASFAIGLNSQEQTFSEFKTTLVTQDVVGDFSVAPAQVGAAEVHLYFSPPGGVLAAVKAITLTFENVAEQSTKSVALVVAGPNHWLGVTDFDSAGSYIMTVSGKTSNGQPLRYQAQLMIQ